MRWNLALDYGIPAAEEFLAIHQTLMGGAIPHHLYRDVVAVIDLVADIDPNDPLPHDDLAVLEAYVAAGAGTPVTLQPVVGDRPLRVSG